MRSWLVSFIVPESCRHVPGASNTLPSATFLPLCCQPRSVSHAPFRHWLQSDKHPFLSYVQSTRSLLPFRLTPPFPPDQPPPVRTSPPRFWRNTRRGAASSRSSCACWSASCAKRAPTSCTRSPSSRWSRRPCSRTWPPTSRLQGELPVREATCICREYRQ